MRSWVSGASRRKWLVCTLFCLELTELAPKPATHHVTVQSPRPGAGRRRTTAGGGKWLVCMIFRKLLFFTLQWKNSQIRFDILQA